MADPVNVDATAGAGPEAPPETGSDEVHPRRVAVRVAKDAARQIRGGHPWVFDASVTSVRPPGRTGDLAVIFDDRRDFMAIGLYDPDSPIRIRVLHEGRPRPIDGSFFAERLAAALERRSVLAEDPSTDAYRMLHGENDGLPGLVMDRYADTVVVKAYTSAWLVHLPRVITALESTMAPGAVVLRLARNVDGGSSHHDAQVLRGALEDPAVEFLENGLRFEADVFHGHKTGAFLDQRDNRARIRSVADRARVLDVYACTGGFSVNAAAGGAQLVHRVDVSAPALAAARRNMELNASLEAVRRCHEIDTVGDATEVMASLATSGRRFDIVVVDPPAFASRGAHIGRALSAYGRLAELAVRLVEPGGLLMQASCSAWVGTDAFVDTVRGAAGRRGVRLSIQSVTGAGVDHPVGFPQGEYLKALFARVHPE